MGSLWDLTVVATLNHSSFLGLRSQLILFFICAIRTVAFLVLSSFTFQILGLVLL